MRRYEEVFLEPDQRQLRAPEPAPVGRAGLRRDRAAAVRRLLRRIDARGARRGRRRPRLAWRSSCRATAPTSWAAPRPSSAGSPSTSPRPAAPSRCSRLARATTSRGRTRVPPGRSARPGRGRPPFPGAVPVTTRRHAWLQQRILRGGAAPPGGGAALGGGVGGEPGALRRTSLRHGRELRPRLLRAVPVRHDARGVPLVAERAVLIPCLHDEPFAHLGVVRDVVPRLPGLHLQLAARGGAGRQALRDRRPPGGRRRSRLRSRRRPPTPSAFRRRHGLEGPLLVYLGRKETGKNVPLLIEYALRYRAVRRADLTLVLAGDGPVTAPAGHGRGPGPGLPRRRRQGGGLRGRRRWSASPRSTSPSRSSLWRPGSRERRSSSTRAARSRLITFSRPGAAWPSTTSTSSPRPWISCWRTGNAETGWAARAAPTSRPSTPGRPSPPASSRPWSGLVA